MLFSFFFSYLQGMQHGDLNINCTKSSVQHICKVFPLQLMRELVNKHKWRETRDNTSQTHGPPNPKQCLLLIQTVTNLAKQVCFCLLSLLSLLSLMSQLSRCQMYFHAAILQLVYTNQWMLVGVFLDKGIVSDTPESAETVISETIST